MQEETIPEAPQHFQEIYKDLKEPEVKKGNNYAKPNRFARELKIKKQKDQELEEKKLQQEKKEKERLKKEITKKKFARLLSKKTNKGQPKLNNTLMHLCNKLGIKK